MWSVHLFYDPYESGLLLLMTVLFQPSSHISTLLGCVIDSAVLEIMYDVVCILTLSSYRSWDSCECRALLSNVMMHDE